MIVLLRDQHWNLHKKKIKFKTLSLLSEQQAAAAFIVIKFGIIPMTNIPWNVISKCLKTRETIIFQVNIIILFLKRMSLLVIILFEVTPSWIYMPLCFLAYFPPWSLVITYCLGNLSKHVVFSPLSRYKMAFPSRQYCDCF